SNSNSPLLGLDYTGHELDELDFENDLKIGNFEVHDYFNDGSFYLLGVPGHATRIISMLSSAQRQPLFSY
ncbi:hypothetical protein BJ875DRAFT_381177, partial [Amylocarpus encephaloides]